METYRTWTDLDNISNDTVAVVTSDMSKEN